jgi:hypothetical protein
MAAKPIMIKVSMNKVLPVFLFSLGYLFLFLFSPLILLTHAQLAGCAEIDIGIPGAQQQVPPQCQTKGVTCNNVNEIDNTSYTNSGNHSVSVTVWNCDHAAPLVLFVPGRGRNATDYARYEKAIADQGFTVAGINFGSENDGNHFSQEVADTKFLIGKLEADSKFNIQQGKVGLVGHSDGGLVTSMEGYQGNNDPSIKAIISADGFASGGSSGPPLLLLHGSKDQLDPTPPNLGAYNATPKYHAEIIGADHFCYVSEKSVSGYAINCATAGLQQQTTALDAITAAFLQNELLGCGDSLSSVASQYKNYITLQQSENSSFPACSTSGTSGGLTNPFPNGWITGRLDMGYDGTFKTKIVAPFAGTITYVCSGGCGWGGGYLTLRAAQKRSDLPTSTLYFAEGINPTVHFKQNVKAGDTIATPGPNGFGCGVGCIEWGVAEDGPANPTNNTYIDTYSHFLKSGKCPHWTTASRDMVHNFFQWAQKNFHVPNPVPTYSLGLDCAGSA